MSRKTDNVSGDQDESTCSSLGEVTNFLSITNEIATSKTKFRSKRVENLFAWWNSFQPNLPKSSDFDILNHLNDAPYIFRYKVLGKNEFEIRLNGEAATEILGNSYKGVYINAATSKDHEHLKNLSEYLQRICDQKIALSCIGDYEDAFGRAKQFQSLDCPLVDDNGAVTHIVGIMETIT